MTAGRTDLSVIDVLAVTPGHRCVLIVNCWFIDPGLSTPEVRARVKELDLEPEVSGDSATQDRRVAKHEWAATHLNAVLKQGCNMRRRGRWRLVDVIVTNVKHPIDFHMGYDSSCWSLAELEEATIAEFGEDF